MKLHKGDPCEYCGLPHNDVLIGDCKGADAPDFDPLQLPYLVPTKALRMFNLWRERRLPADVVVIEVPIERTGCDDFRYRLPVYGALPTQVLHDEQEPFSLQATVAVQMHRYADPATGAQLYLGWNEYPPRLIVGREKERE